MSFILRIGAWFLRLDIDRVHPSVVALTRLQRFGSLPPEPEFHDPSPVGIRPVSDGGIAPQKERLN